MAAMLPGLGLWKHRAVKLKFKKSRPLPYIHQQCYLSIPPLSLIKMLEIPKRRRSTPARSRTSPQATRLTPYVGRKGGENQQHGHGGQERSEDPDEGGSENIMTFKTTSKTGTDYIQKN